MPSYLSSPLRVFHVCMCVKLAAWQLEIGFPISLSCVFVNTVVWEPTNEHANPGPLPFSLASANPPEEGPLGEANGDKSVKRRTMPKS